MRKSLAMLCASTLVALVLGSPAQAAVKWSYGANTKGATGDNNVYNTNNPFKTSMVQFDGVSNNVEGDTGIIVARMVAVFDKNQPDVDGPDSIDGTSNAKFTISLTVTDTMSQESKTFTWDGRFKGNNFTATSFSAPKDAFTWDGTLLQSAQIGTAETGFRTYNVEITSATPPGAPGDPGGAVYADVTVTDGPPTGGGETPEPATLAMAAFGIPALFAFRRRFQSK